MLVYYIIVGFWLIPTHSWQAFPMAAIGREATHGGLQILNRLN